jgi:ribose-phosphate pyrophosphokinase
MLIINDQEIDLGIYYSGEIYLNSIKINEQENVIKFYIEPKSDNVLKLIFVIQKMKQIYPNTKITLYMDYVPYSREDKDTNHMELFSTFLELLNVQKIVTTPDLHCRNEQLEKHNIVIEGLPYWKTVSLPEDVIYILPDNGSKVRYEKYLDDVEHITCSKKRTDGEVVGLVIDEDYNLKENTTYVVIDDLCSGGATFKNVAQLLPKKAKKILIVAYMESSAYNSGFNKENLSLYSKVHFGKLI